MTADQTFATRRSLLERIKHWSDQQSWQDFFDRYWRLIYSTARQAGLSDAEAQDVVQNTLLAVAQSIKAFKYHRTRASFKTWLMRLTHWRILKQIDQRQKTCSPGTVHPDFLADDSLEELPDPAGINLEAVWEGEWQKHLYTTARDEVKKKISPAQMQLFDLYVTQQWSVPEICRALQISAARVYLTKHRVSRLIEKEVRRLEKGNL